MNRLLFAAACLLGAAAQAGQFNYGFASSRSNQVTLRRPTMPEVFLNVKRVAVEVQDATNSFADAEGLRLEIERRLTQGFQIAPSQPEARIRVTVGPFDAPVVRARYLVHNVGQVPAQAGAAGAAPAPVTAPVLVGTETSTAVSLCRSGATDQQQIPQPAAGQVLVEYWEGCGQLGVRLEVVGPAGEALDGAPLMERYLQRVPVSVNGVDRLDRSRLPTAAAIYQQLLARVLARIGVRYLQGYEELRIKLAADEELRDANRLAEANQWASAVGGWEGAVMKKCPADRLYNLAVAREWQAYEDFLAGKPIPVVVSLFQKALMQFEEAIRQDSKEKYFVEAAARLRESQRRLEMASANYRRQVAAETVSIPTAQTAPAPATPAAPDGPRPGEEDYRQLLRLRLRSLEGSIGPADRARLQSAGRTAYRLSDFDASRILTQEAERWTKLYPALKTYKESYDAFMADQKVSDDERAVLNKLAANLKLSPEDIQAVEGGSVIFPQPAQ